MTRTSIHNFWPSVLFATTHFFAIACGRTALAGESAEHPAQFHAEPAGVSVKSLGIKYGDNGAVAELELRNGGKQSATFGGYSLTSPSYRKQCLTHDRWKDDQMGWCGNGLETQTLRPGQAVRFMAPLCPFPQSTKIGVVIRTQQDPAGQLVWSDAVVEKSP